MKRHRPEQVLAHALASSDVRVTGSGCPCQQDCCHFSAVSLWRLPRCNLQHWVLLAVPRSAMQMTGSARAAQHRARLQVHVVARVGVGALAGRAVEEDDADDGAAVPGRCVCHFLRMQPAGVGPEEQRRRCVLHPAPAPGHAALLQSGALVPASALGAACCAQSLARQPKLL